MLVDFRSTTAWSKRDNSWPIKKMMYETTDLQHLKLKKGRSVSVSLQLLHNSRYQFITDHYQWEICGRGFSDTIVLSSNQC